MQDLIQLAIPVFMALVILEVVAGSITKREIYQVKDALPASAWASAALPSTWSAKSSNLLR
jgi:hypothetical protein